MTFLDELPLDFTRPEVRELEDLLVIAYEERASAKRVAYEAGLPRGTFPDASNARLRWFALLEALARAGRVRAMVVAASRDPGLAPDVRARLADFLDEAPAVSPTTPPVSTATAPITREAFDQRLLAGRARFLDVQVLSRLHVAARSVALLEFTAGGRRYHGTGVLVGRRHVLTNHHNTTDAEGAPMSAMRVDFECVRGVVQSEAVYRWNGVPPSGDAELDWALIELDSDVADRTPVALASDAGLVEGDTLFIVQHPSRLPKQFSMHWRAVTAVLDRHVQYVVDTQRGSSGAPVFNERVELVAIHHRGQPAGREGLLCNQGVLIGPILSAMRDTGLDPQEA